MTWYYARGDARMGPVDDEELEQLAASGAVTPQTLVWKEGMADWQPFETVSLVSEIDSEIPESLFGAQAMGPCADCGRTFAHEDMVAYEDHWVCANCKDTFFQRIREGSGTLIELRYAGFWIRFLAYVIDGVIMGFAGFIQMFVQSAVVDSFGYQSGADYSGPDIAIFMITWVISFGIGIWYAVYFVGKFGATPGKMVFGLKIVRSDGSKVSYGRATGRYFATILSTMTLLIGFIMAAFDGEKRALHDRICDTRVVRT